MNTASEERRKPLLRQMQQLAQKGIVCNHCVGTCCTYTRNSMQITPLEAHEIVEFLSKTEEKDVWYKRMSQTISEFRLDHSGFGNGKRSFLRRTYTCPFFAVEGHPGCALPPEIKPFGCLGYNPERPLVLAGEACSSDTQALIQREAVGRELGEPEMNEQVSLQQNTNWPKLPIPVAIKEFFDRM